MLRSLTRSDGVRLSYAVEGSGTPVVLLHGFATHRAVWDPVVEGLRDAPISTYAVDLRGHGESTAMTEPTAIDGFADDLAALLESLDLRQAVLVGHSLGGMVVQAFWQRHPAVLHRIRGVLLVNTSANPLASRATRAVGWYFQTRVPDLVHRSPLLSYGFARVAFPSRVPRETVLALAAIAPPQLLSRRHFAIRSVPDFRPHNAGIDLNVTVLASTKDLAVSVHDSAALAESLPRARLRLVSGTGHLLPLERPTAVIEEVLRLAECPQYQG